MTEKGYKAYLNTEEQIKDYGYGGFALVTPSDDFAVYFELHCYIHPRIFMLRAVDRNGIGYIEGTDAAEYYISATPDMDMEVLTSKFKTMLKGIYEKYKEYSRDNRLDFKFNQLKLDERNYDNIDMQMS